MKCVCLRVGVTVVVLLNIRPELAQALVLRLAPSSGSGPLLANNYFLKV